jgi:hypothetical protein
MTFCSTTIDVGRTVSDPLAVDDAGVPGDQADLIVVLLFVAMGLLLTATFSTAGSLTELGQILGAS